MLIYERNEENIAVLYDDNGKKYTVPVDKFEKTVDIGDVVFEKDGVYCSDKKKTQQRKNENLSLLRRLGL